MIKIKTVVMILAILILFSSVPGLGNSAEPPSILIIVPNANDDIKINLSSEDSVYQGRKIDKTLEKYFAFYSSQMRSSDSYTLIVESGKESFEIVLDKPMNYYNNIFTLNLKDKSLTEGKLFSRSVFLVSTRLLLTLILEAAIFWLFRFKDKKSWAAFAAINIITQGALNLWLNGFTPVQSYIVFSLIVGEFFVFAAEIAGFLLFLREHSSLRRILYVLTANIISLVAGGFIITILPI